ncbi:MAG: dockerin type I repeat-containing protein [candidate division Zixibacteria bacterium]|nr:dockerin type I repeat-containing protein [candidate division Zixibacteria bacterium]
MKKIKLGMILLAVVALFAVVVVHAQSNKQAQPKKAKQKAISVQLKDKVEPKQITPAVSEPKIAPVNIPERAPVAGSKQGYLMVTDVLDGFGGESESDNYRIPVNSGGQPSAIGISQSDSFVVEAGFVHASHVNRGDANADGVINLGDIVYLINYLYRAGLEPCPVEAGDVNCDGIVQLGDIVYLINYVFKDGPPPAC